MSASNLDYVLELLRLDLQCVAQCVEVGLQQVVDLLSHCYVHGRWEGVIGALQKIRNTEARTELTSSAKDTTD